MAAGIGTNDTESTPTINVECRTPTKVVGDKIEKPYVGKIFKSIEAARDYYEKYGVNKGFSVVQNSSQSTQARYDGITSVLFACSHYGSHDKKVDENVPIEKRRPNTSTMRGGCEAQMRILLSAKTVEWVVRRFEDDHNHAFVATPRFKKSILGVMPNPQKTVYIDAERYIGLSRHYSRAFLTAIYIAIYRDIDRYLDFERYRPIWSKLGQN
ncbi:hypothetical protein ACHQM5_004303 [Ranunculus cassubicifolius]